MRPPSRSTIRRAPARVLGLMLVFFGPSLVAKPIPEKIAALEQEISAAGAAPRFDSLVQLSYLLEADDTVRATALAGQARAAAATPAEKLRADLWIDYLLWRQGRQVEALQGAREGVTRARALHDDELLARGLLVVASAQDRMADFPAAIETYHELVPLADRLPDLSLRSQVYDQFGVTYFKTNDLDAAEAAFDQAKAFARQSGDPLLLPPVIAHLGNLARERGDNDRGRALLQESVDLRIENGADARGIADQEINLGAIGEDLNDLPTALAHYQRAVALHEKMGFTLNHANAEQCLAGILTRMGRTDEALAHLGTALRLVEPTGSKTILGRVYRELARVNEARGDYRAALGFARQQAAAEDAALGEKSRSRLDLLNTSFQAERRQHEIELLEQQRLLQVAELSRVRWQRYSLGLGAGALAALLALLARRLREERRLRRETEIARGAAEEADRLKTRLLGIASHDLKGPLNSITHGADLLARDVSDRPEIVTTARQIRETARRTHLLVRDLIDVAALESGGLRLQRAAIDLTAVVADVVAEHRPLAERKRIMLAFPSPGGAIPIEGDFARLRQAVDNLVDNALKFTGSGRSVRVAARVEAGQGCVEVADEGPGLTAADLAQLFQPFRPLSSLPTGGESSTGLGLHLSREIVALHGGRIVADSAPGSGAVFRILLPLASCASA